MKRVLFTSILTFVLLACFAVPTAAAPAEVVIPTIGITSVVVDSSVTIITYNFPANDTFTVRMGKMGTKGIGGEVVGTWSSGSGGSKTATFTIPEALKGLYWIAIRLESPTSGYYAYNWFYNKTTGGTGGPVVGLPSGVIPTFTITSVDVDKTVTIKTSNFPANDTFTVRMNVMHTKGINGTVVKTINSGAGGSFTATFDIPDGLKGLYQIAIRLESPTSGYYAYNWFYNKTTGGTGGPVVGLPAGVIPTFSISAVVEDSTVTILTSNFPANDTFNVRMNVIGTRGIGGTLVKTINSGAGGSFSATFDIPAGLKGQNQIAIRLESPTSGYYAYNWFWNK
ncbi:MAG TPA: hypothetical protein VIO61_14215 [Anaerolineaceae bacterium]